MSVLALLGLRYPIRMLPILLFNRLWWLTGSVKSDGGCSGSGSSPSRCGRTMPLKGATRVQAGAVLWVVTVIVAIPSRYVFTKYVMSPGDP